jgi:hypothetical protein
MYFPKVILVPALSALLVASAPVEEFQELQARAAKTISYDCGPSGTPQICLNACWAQNCRKLPAVLHGGAGASGDAKRTEWGYGQKTKWAPYQWGTNTSPEEYPYASSKEGGLNGGGKTLALRCVPTTEQSSK